MLVKPVKGDIKTLLKQRPATEINWKDSQFLLV